MGHEEKQAKHKKKKKEIVQELEVDYRESEALRDFEFGETIGIGSFGKVFRARNILDNNHYAIKIISKAYMKQDDVGKLRGEAMILSSLNHPNIVMLKSLIETPTKLYLVMELVKNGTLRQLIAQRRENEIEFTDEEVATILRGILRAVSYLHNKNIIHRDLKPENILIENREDLSSVKIVDFGLSTQFSVSSMKMLTQKCGTILYMAPEFTREQQYSKPVDIWSCGIIMYQLLSKGRHPLFRHNDDKQTFIKKLRNPVWKFNDNFTKFAKDFFLKLTKTEASERYSVNQALKHPWITRNFDDNIPFTFFENNYLFQKQLDFVYLTKAMLFLAYLKKSLPSLGKKNQIEYLKPTDDYSSYYKSNNGMKSDKSDNRISFLSPWTSDEEINFRESEMEDESEKNTSIIAPKNNNITNNNQINNKNGTNKIRARPYSLSMNPEKDEQPKIIKLQIHNEPKSKNLSVFQIGDLHSLQEVSKSSYYDEKKIISPPFSEAKRLPNQESSTKTTFILRTNSPVKSPAKQAAQKSIPNALINPIIVNRASTTQVEGKDVISPKTNNLIYQNRHRIYNSIASTTFTTASSKNTVPVDNMEFRAISNKIALHEEEKQGFQRINPAEFSYSPQKKLARTIGDGTLNKGYDVNSGAKLAEAAMAKTVGRKDFSGIKIAIRKSLKSNEIGFKQGDSPPVKQGYNSERKNLTNDFHLPKIFENGEMTSSPQKVKKNI